MIRNYLFVSLGFIFLFSSFTTGTHKHAYKIKTIVIDAGHGGHDSGCIGSSGKEKHVALDVALKLGKLIEEKFPDVKVIYTRKTDVFVELHERAEIANRSKADLFLCIHCNSGPPSAFGVETFVMGLHKTDDNLSVARRENSSILLEKDYKQKYDGFDPHSPEANIIFSLYQNSFLAQSLKLAALIQNQTEEYAGRYNRGVKQAGFLVLYRTTMPSLLIETGFLTNRSEEKYLLSDKGQSTIATALFRAFNEYKIDMEAGGEQQTATPKDDVPKNIPQVKPDEKKTAAKAETSAVKATTKELTLENDSPAAAHNETFEIKFPVDIFKSREEPKVTVEKPKEETKTSAQTEEIKQPELFYTVQLGAIPTESESELKKFNALKNVFTLQGDDGLIRVVHGMYYTFAKATEMQSEIRSKGFKDAFVTAYYKGKRITIKEAQAMRK